MSRWFLLLALSTAVAGCPTTSIDDDDGDDDDSASGDDDTGDDDTGDDDTGDDDTGDDDTGDDDTGDDDTGDDDTSDPPCPYYESQEEEYSPIQTVGAGLPAPCAGMTWQRPAAYVYLGAFSGQPSQPATHEGVDYVHDDPGVGHVMVHAAADGTVIYVRLGCPQSTLFSSNQSLRECGAGWGNHVVVDHGDGVVTRYAHLHPATTVVQVGDGVSMGDPLAEMGNSGRSDVRHLHFELGTDTDGLDPCDHAQSFERVYDSELLTFSP